MLGCLFGALIALLLSSLAKADEPGVVVLTDQSFSRVVIQSKTPSFVQFHAPWCHYCKMMIPAWMELAGIFHDKVLVGKIDCDSNTGIRQKYGIQAFPTLKLFQRGQVEDFSGPRTLDGFKNFLIEKGAVKTPVDPNVEIVLHAMDTHRGSFEAVKLALAELEIPFSQTSYANEELWQASAAFMKVSKSASSSDLPVLEVSSDGVFVQGTVKSLRYLARRFSLGGKSLDKQYRVDLLLDALEEMESDYSELASGEFCSKLPRLTHPRASVVGSKDPQQCSAFVYQHGDFSGWEAEFVLQLSPKEKRSINFFGENYTKVGARDDDASSLKVVGPTGCIVKVFGNEIGNSVEWSSTFGVGEYEFAAFTAGGAENDAASALQIYFEEDLSEAPEGEFSAVDVCIDRYFRHGKESDSSKDWAEAETGAQAFIIFLERHLSQNGFSGGSWIAGTKLPTVADFFAFNLISEHLNVHHQCLDTNHNVNDWFSMVATRAGVQEYLTGIDPKERFPPRQKHANPPGSILDSKENPTDFDVAFRAAGGVSESGLDRHESAAES